MTAFNQDFKPRKVQILTILTDGLPKQHLAFHIGTLAARLGRSVPTLYSWERNGALPRTPFATDSEKPERLYTMEMINIVEDIFRKRNGRVSVKDTSFYEEIRSAWEKTGVIVQ